MVDNASTDGTSDIAHAFHCTVIEEGKVGQLYAKRRGVDSARGDIIAMLDADCIPGPGYISAIESSFGCEDRKQPIGVTCYYHFQDGAPCWARLYNYLVPLLLLKPFQILGLSMPFVIGGNVAFRREAIVAHGGYPVRGGIGATEWTLAAILRRRGPVRYLSDLHVTSGLRRFETGWWEFLVNYKMSEYLLPLLTSRKA